MFRFYSAFIIFLYGTWLLSALFGLLGGVDCYVLWTIGSSLLGLYPLVMYYSLWRDSLFVCAIDREATRVVLSADDYMILDADLVSSYVRHSARAPLLDFRKLRLGAHIADGAHGSVYRGVYAGEDVAAKSIMCEDLRREDVLKVCREAGLMSQFDHPNVVRFIGVCPLPPEIYLISRYYSNGDLHSYLRKLDPPPSYERILQMCLDAARGVGYLHNRNPPVIWRDCKSRNYLVDEKGHLVVADLGESRELEVPVAPAASPAVAVPSAAPQPAKRFSLPSLMETFSRTRRSAAASIMETADEDAGADARSLQQPLLSSSADAPVSQPPDPAATLGSGAGTGPTGGAPGAPVPHQPSSDSLGPTAPLLVSIDGDASARSDATAPLAVAAIGSPTSSKRGGGGGGGGGDGGGSSGSSLRSGGARMTIGIGTPGHAAPEVMMRRTDYGLPADIFGLGIVMWEIYTQRDPFEEYDESMIEVALLRGERPPIPTGCPADFAELLRSAWHQQPAQRPTASQIVLRLSRMLDRERGRVAHIRQLAAAGDGSRTGSHAGGDTPDDAATTA